jgi:cytochrome o ubiquinol oxidase subunit III
MLWRGVTLVKDKRGLFTGGGMMPTSAVTMTALTHGETTNHDAMAIQTLGFWMYLMSDLIVFSGLFATYVVLAPNNAGGPTAKELFHVSETFIETIFLLCSSAAFGFTTLAMHDNKKRLVLSGLVVTFLLGLCFIFMEVSEFHRMILDGAGPDRSGFLSAFFTLVGTHGVHVTFGLVWLAVMLGQVFTKGLTTPVRSRLMRLGMFWHFLDIIWVGLFSVVYLMGVM